MFKYYINYFSPMFWGEHYAVLHNIIKAELQKNYIISVDTFCINMYSLTLRNQIDTLKGV